MNILLDTFKNQYPYFKNNTKYSENIKNIYNDFIIFSEITKRALEYLVDTQNIFKWFIKT